jgi:hypothetical protein
MLAMSTWDSRDAGSVRERVALIREGMEVADATGERIGKVTDVRIGDPDAIDFGGEESPTRPAEGFALAMGAHREPNVAAGLVGRLLRNGYIKIDDRRRFRRDHHYYATADQIAGVDGNTVRLNGSVADLITPLT